MKKMITSLLSRSLYKSAYSRASYTLLGIVWKEITNCFRQFFTWRFPIRSLFRCITIMSSGIMRLILGRSLKYSFAFTGEDRIIESILKPRIQENGFYVDVGCNHPTFLSNTYSLYRKGWRGICIDANPELIKKFAWMRPRDKAICAAVSDGIAQREFYLVENSVLSTIEPNAVKKVETEKLDYWKIQVTTQPLNSILLQNSAPLSIDLLSIDAEEHDFNILRGLDFSTFRPRLVVIEYECEDITHIATSPINSFMTAHGYQLEGYVLKNLYFALHLQAPR